MSVLLVGLHTIHEGDVPVPLLQCFCGLHKHRLGTFAVMESVPIDGSVPQHTHPVAEIEGSHWSVRRMRMDTIGQLRCKYSLWIPLVS